VTVWGRYDFVTFCRFEQKVTEATVQTLASRDEAVHSPVFWTGLMRKCNRGFSRGSVRGSSRVCSRVVEGLVEGLYFVFVVYVLWAVWYNYYLNDPGKKRLVI